MNSELAGILGSFLIGAVTWLVNKARGVKQADIRTTVDGLVGQAIHLAVTSADQHPQNVREQVSRYVWLGLAEAKVPRNAAVEFAVNAAIEYGIAKALEALRAHDRAVELAVAANAKAAQDAVAEAASKYNADLTPKVADPVFPANPTPPDDVTILPPSTEFKKVFP